MLMQVIADLQRAPNRDGKCRVGEDHHLQAKAEHVRIDYGQRSVRTQPRQLKKIKKLAPINAMLAPAHYYGRETSS
jgi:hypothetical protein